MKVDRITPFVFESSLENVLKIQELFRPPQKQITA